MEPTPNVKRGHAVRAAIGILIAAASVGLTMFGTLAWRSISLRSANSSDALRQFESIRSGFSTTTPLVERDDSGRFVRREPISSQTQRPTKLRVMAYRAAEERLVSADVPLWFFRVKGPAVQLALRGTSFDLEALGLTASDLERVGTRIILDETRDNGDRVLAWTE